MFKFSLNYLYALSSHDAGDEIQILFRKLNIIFNVKAMKLQVLTCENKKIEREIRF